LAHTSYKPCEAMRNSHPEKMAQQQHATEKFTRVLLWLAVAASYE
jgi:hypothetical protein